MGIMAGVEQQRIERMAEKAYVPLGGGVIQHGFPGNPLALFHHNNKQKGRAESQRNNDHA